MIMRLLLPIAAFLSFQCSFIEAFEKSDFLVTGLGDIEPAYDAFDGDMYAGLLPIDIEPAEKRGELMFWFFQPTSVDHDSVTIWLNGGPGCTSFSAGVMFEISPVTSPHFPAGYPETPKIQPLSPNEWAWTKATNLLFVEQPAGTGFSKGPMPKSEADLSLDFYNFMVNFYETFPEMKSKKLFVVGESYAGMYVPSIAHKINQENKKGQRHMNLAGIALGNGWMDAKVQGETVIDYAYWHGMIDSTARLALHEKWRDCVAGARMNPPFHDFTTPDECNLSGVTLMVAGAGIFPNLSPNTYDVTTWDRYPILNDPHNTYDEFYNNPEVKKALHAPMDDTYWLGCIPGAGRRLEDKLPGEILLSHDVPISTVPYVAELLDDGIKVLVYNGDRDLSVNAQGSEKLLDSMDWSGADGWSEARRSLWMVNDKVAGYAKSYAKLDFVIVYNSGHLVPNNVPVPALDLIKRFVNDESYLDIELPYFQPRSRRPVCMMDESNWPMFHAVLILIVAVVCFFCGFVAAWYFGGRKGYKRIPDSNMNGYH